MASKSTWAGGVLLWPMRAEMSSTPNFHTQKETVKEKIFSIATNRQPCMCPVSLNLAIYHLAGTRLWAVEFPTVQMYYCSIWDHKPVCLFPSRTCQMVKIFHCGLQHNHVRSMTTENGCFVYFRCRSVLGQLYHSSSCDVSLWWEPAGPKVFYPTAKPFFQQKETLQKLPVQCYGVFF